MRSPSCCSDPAPGTTVSLEEAVLVAVLRESQGLDEFVHPSSLTVLQTSLQDCIEEQNS